LESIQAYLGEDGLIADLPAEGTDHVLAFVALWQRQTVNNCSRKIGSLVRTVQRAWRLANTVAEVSLTCCCTHGLALTMPCAALLLLLVSKR
jgi:hypothetical protein